MSEKKVVRRRKVRRKKKQKTIDKKIWMIIGGIIAGLVIVYLAISVFFMSHFYINTQINGKNFSGKNAAAVENYIKNQMADYKLTIVEQNNMTDAIEGSDISLVYKENSDIEDALKKQNAFLWPQAFFSKSSAEVTIEVGYDEAALESKIESVQALNQEQTDPQSAYPKYDGNSFVVEPEVYGTKVDVDTFKAKVKDAITNFKSELNMMDEKCYAMPKYTSESPEVQKACDAMNNYLKASITYKMTNQNVVVNKDLISGWVTYDDNMNATLDESKVKEWLREFGKTYDTVGTTRSITTPGGKTVDVSGGTYGWSVDEAAELTALVDSIKKGEVVEKEPAYAQTAATHDAQDWGTTYLEVDIPAQHMWYVVNGAVQLETDVVTGLPTPERETPTGVYSILEMKRDKVLTGTIDPSTGKPIYQTPVAYWMRVTWTGVGIPRCDMESKFWRKPLSDEWFSWMYQYAIRPGGKSLRNA